MNNWDVRRYFDPDWTKDDDVTSGDETSVNKTGDAIGCWTGDAKCPM